MTAIEALAALVAYAVGLVSIVAALAPRASARVTPKTRTRLEMVCMLGVIFALAPYIAGKLSFFVAIALMAPFAVGWMVLFGGHLVAAGMPVSRRSRT